MDLLDWGSHGEYGPDNGLLVAALVTFTAMGLLSIFGCIAIILAFFFLADTRTLSRQLLFGIAVSEAIMTMGYIIGTWEMYGQYPEFLNTTTIDGKEDRCNTNDTVASTQLCVIQGCISNMASIASFIFNTGLSVFLLHMAITLTPSLLIVIVVNVLAFTIPLVISIAATANERYGFSRCTTGGWCWLVIKNDGNDLLWFFVAGKLWEQGSDIIICCNYLILGVVIYTRRRKNENADADALSAMQSLEALYSKLLLVPLFFLACTLPGFVRSLILVGWNGEDIGDQTVGSGWKHLLFFLHGLGNNATGFCNFVLFIALNESMRHKIWDLLVNSRPPSTDSRVPHLRASDVSSSFPVPVDKFHYEDTDEYGSSSSDTDSE